MSYSQRLPMKSTLLILAAGIGSRYGGLKQIEPVGPAGEIIIDYSIYDALRSGFGELVFVIRRDIEKPFRASIGSKFENCAEVVYAFQTLENLPVGFAPKPDRKKPWGTAHAVLAADHVIHEPFGIINADDFYGRESYEILSRHLQSAADTERLDCAIVGFILRNTLSEHGTVARGICRCDENRYLLDIVEMTRIARDGQGAVNTADDGTRSRLTGDEWTSMNMWGFSPSVFPLLREKFEEFLLHNASNPKAEFYIPTAIGALVRENRVRTRILPSPAGWFGVTYPQDKPVVVQNIRQLIARGIYPERLWDNGLI